MIDRLKLYQERVDRLIEPNEKPLVLTQIGYFSGEERIGDVNDSWSFDPINGLTVDKWERGTLRLLGGVTLISPPQSLAIDLVRLCGPVSYVLLTNQRLILIENLSNDDRVAYPSWQCPLEKIADITPAPRGLFGRGKVRFTFTDTSFAVLTTGMITTKNARKLVSTFAALRNGEH